MALHETTAWRMFYRTTDDLDFIHHWRNQGLATELAAYTTWIRNQAKAEGLEPHPTAMASFYTLDEGEELTGLCVSIPVKADPDPRYVAPIEPVRAMRDRETRSELARSRRSAGALLLAGVLIVLVIIAAALLLTAPRGAPDASPASAAAWDRPGLPGAPAAIVAGRGSAPSAGGDLAVPAGDPGVAIAAPRWAGTATWYCSSSSPCTRGYGPSDRVAAIDSDLGIPKGALVLVRSQAGPGEVTVRIVDVCLCAGERLIDLTSGAFKQLAPLEAGVIAVTIELVSGRVPRATLPPTSTEGANR